MGYGETILAYLLFWLGLYTVSKIFRIERFGFKTGPLYLIYRTVRFNNVIGRMASKRRFWRIVWNIGISVGFGQILFITLTLVRNLFLLAVRSERATPITVLIPGITISWETLPYILFSLAVLVASHELAHGIASIADGIPLKSSGMFFAAIMPGAFVEVDEDLLKKAEEIKQLRIFSAGSFANIALGALSILLIINFASTISPFFNPTPQGVMVAGLTEGSAAERYGMRRWDVIYSISATKIRGVDDLTSYMSGVKPGDVIIMGTDRGEVTLKTQPHPLNSTKAMIGISPFNYYPPKILFLSKSTPYHLYMTWYWLNVLLISVALINMLPLHPLDGGRYVHALLRIFKVRRSEGVRNAISAFSLAILALNIALTFVNFGLRKL
ncbi:MAG: site-2 protease family protein [Candidatus Bathyarchaeia archaeon]